MRFESFRFPRAILLCVSCLVASEARAQTRGPDSVSYNLPEIMVTASPVLVPSPGVVREVGVEDFEAVNAHSVSDILAHSTGMSIQHGTTGDANVLVRGFRHRDVLFLFDGIPIASAFEGTIDLNEVAIEHVGRIKMVKGAPSVIYGTNAMGGVIDIIPKSGSDARIRQVGLELAENDRLALRGTYGGFLSPLEYFVSASYDAADGYSVSEDYDPETNEDGGLRANSDLTRRNVFMNLRAKSDAIGTTSFVLNVSDNERGYPPQAGIDEPDLERLVDSKRTTVGLSNDFDFLPVSLRLYYNGFRSSLATFEDLTFAEVDEIDKGEDDAYGTTLYSRLATSPGNVLISSLTYEQARYKNESDPEAVQDFRADTYTLALEDELAFRERWRLSAGGLLSRFEQPENGMHLSAVNAQIGLGYNLTPALALQGSAARRTRFPKLRELYRERYGNPELDEQRANNFEVGIKHASASGIESDFALFLNQIDGLIDRVDRQSPYENLDDVTFRGIETACGGWLTHHAYGKAGYTLVDAEETLPDGDVRQLRRIPRHSVNGEIRYRFPANIEVGLNAIYVSGLYDLDADDVHTRVPDYFLLGSKVSIVPVKGWSVYAAASNLTDEDYVNRIGFPLEGQAVQFGSAYDF